MTKEEKLLKLSKRAPELDILRGIAVLFMIFDHFMYDCYDMMGYFFYDYGKTEFTRELVRFARNYWNWDVRVVFRQFILFVFLGLTGICCSFSKSNLKRGFKLMAVAIGLTVATYGIGVITGDIEITITFGALACIATALIVIGLMELALKKVKWGKWVYLALGIIMVPIGFYLLSKSYHRYFVGSPIFELLYEQIIGISECGSDSFPFILYGGEVFIGVFLGKMFYKERKSIFKAEYKNNILTFVGRNSLIVYFAHQVIIPVVFAVVLLLCGFELAL